MQYQIAKPVEFGVGVPGGPSRTTLGWETTHELSVVEDPAYLVAGDRTFKRDSVPAAGVIVEINPDALDCQGFTRSEGVLVSHR